MNSKTDYQNVLFPSGSFKSSDQSIVTRKTSILNDLKNQQAKLAVVGLGYVGLPIALEFAKTLSCVGFDIKADRVEMMKTNIDPSGELDRSAFENKNIQFTANVADLKEVKFFIVAVPTPVDASKKPNLFALKSATQMVASVLKKGDYVVFESTVYPGCTEEICQPILEEVSGLKMGRDFKMGYSPERINPGDKNHTLTKITKVVSGCDEESLDIIAEVYKMVIEAGVHRATSIKVAEASKIVENTQRDINIALMNELSTIFEKMDIRTQDVLDAAGTKWNFLKFFPGLVGGHCIGVDPYYLAYKANQIGAKSRLISSARAVNDGMPQHVANRIVTQIYENGVAASEATVLVRGITFKEDVQDIRNSKAAELVQCLKQQGVNIVVEDCEADSEEVKMEYGFETTENPQGPFDCIVIAVPHQQYRADGMEKYRSMCTDQPFIFDFRNIVKDVSEDVCYHTL